MELVRYDAMRLAIAEAHAVDEVKGIRDKAQALAEYAKQSRLSVDDINRCCEIKLRAERRAGELLAEVERAQGRRSDLAETSAQREPKSTLGEQVQEIGVSLASAKRWQMLAELPEPVFEQEVQTIKEAGAELTTAHMLRQVQHFRREQKRESMAESAAWPEGAYRVIYADPPWQYGNAGVIVAQAGSELYGMAHRHYPTMSQADLCALDVQALALPDSVLWLWATVPLLAEALEVIAAWGFEYKTHFVWDKRRHNFGHYSSVQHELLMLATRGSCLPDIDQKVRSVIEVERTGRHSEKPAEFRELIDTLYPHGPRIELFARGSAPGWDLWGNEAEQGEVSGEQYAEVSI